MEYRILEGKSGVRKIYDEMSSRYDFSKYLLWTRKFEKGEYRIVKKWIGRLKSPILDLGCGTGRYTIILVKKGYEVVALDMSQGMISVAREKIRKISCEDKVHFIIGDGEKLPFRNESFGSVICTLTFDHFLNSERAAHEISRVLRISGICIISTFNPHTLNDFRIRHNIPLDKIVFETEDIPPTLVYEVPHSAEDVSKIFNKYGLKTIDIKGCCYWHLLPSFLMKNYPFILDDIFNILKRKLLKYAEIHITIMKK